MEDIFIAVPQHPGQPDVVLESLTPEGCLMALRGIVAVGPLIPVFMGMNSKGGVKITLQGAAEAVIQQFDVIVNDVGSSEGL